MTDAGMRKGFLLVLLAGSSAAFIAMIRQFLLTILLAAIFSALSYPPYSWLLRKLGNRRACAAVASAIQGASSAVIAPMTIHKAGTRASVRTTAAVVIATPASANASSTQCASIHSPMRASVPAFVVTAGACPPTLSASADTSAAQRA